MDVNLCKFLEPEPDFYIAMILKVKFNLHSEFLMAGELF